MVREVLQDIEEDYIRKCPQSGRSLLVIGHLSAVGRLCTGYMYW